MARIPMKDMALTQKEMSANSPVAIGVNYADQPAYPYGLCLRLDHDTLEKLGLLECVKDGECEVGDFTHIFALAKVTNISKNDTGAGERCCVELQITHASVESEDEENEEAEESERKPRRLRYGG